MQLNGGGGGGGGVLQQPRIQITISFTMKLINPEGLESRNSQSEMVANTFDK